MAERVQRTLPVSPGRRNAGEGVFGFLGQDMAVDLGTANTLVYVRRHGIVLNEPSVVAINTLTGAILAVGNEAKRMIGRTPSHIQAVRPLKDGVIADFDVTEKMLRYFIQRVHNRRLLAKPRVVVCVPSVITGVEQRAVEEATISAGARAAYIIEEPMAAAIGAGLPIHEPVGNLVVDVGGGTSEMAVVSMGGIVAGTSIRVGGFDMDAAVQHHIRRLYDVAIGEKTAEQMKMAIGSAYPAEGLPNAQVRGRDLATGMPKEIEVRQDDLREALAETVNAIVQATKDCLAESPPELGHDVLETGIFLTGGGSLLTGMDMRLAQECEVPVHLTEQPLETVVVGAGRMLDSVPEFRSAGLFTRRA